MEQLTIYICGKVTGLDRTKCLAKFSTTQLILESWGYKVINPMEIVPADSNWEDAMSICIKELRNCNGLLMLPDWQFSDGANLEYKEAKKLGIKAIKITDFANGKRF